MKMTSPAYSRRFFVQGNPATKGSKNVGRYGQVYEQSRALRPWMDTVAWTARAERHGLTMRWPCAISLDFYLGKRDLDLDKLERGVWDALVEGRLLEDDKLIVESHAHKVRNALPDKQGVEVYIYRVI